MRVQTYVAAGALVLAGGAVAWGATRASDSGVIHACVDVGPQSTLHLAPPSGQCATGQTPIEWNVQGPQGIPGTPGTPGSTGDVFDNGGTGSGGQLPLRIVLAAPGVYSVTASAQVSRFFPKQINHNVLLARCTLSEPRTKLPGKLMRRQLVYTPANYTGNFAEPVNMNAVVSRGNGGLGGNKPPSVDFSCFLYNTKIVKGITVSNPSLSAIRLGP